MRILALSLVLIIFSANAQNGETGSKSAAQLEAERIISQPYSIKSAGKFTREQSFILSEKTWVTNRNLVEQKFKNGSRYLEPGGSCMVEPQAQISIVGFSKDLKWALVGYIPRNPPIGTRCPIGTLFFLSVEQDLGSLKQVPSREQTPISKEEEPARDSENH